VFLLIIAASGVSIAGILYWVAKHLITSTNSLNELIKSVHENMTVTVEMMQKSIKDFNEITDKLNTQMEKLDSIVENARVASDDVRTSTNMINRTVTPTLGNLHAISAGMKKALDTWNEYGKSEGEEQP